MPNENFDIRLRKLEPQDLPFLYLWENDCSAWGDGATNNFLSQADLRAYIESTTGDIYKDGQLRLMIENADNGASLGCVDLVNLDIRNQKAEVGIYIDRSYRQSGVGHRALELLKDYAFNFLHLRQIYAVVRIDNIASIALFDKAQFEYKALLKQWIEQKDAYLMQCISEYK